MRGFRCEEIGEEAALLVVLGRFGVGSLIRFGFFRFRFVHVGDGDLVFSGSPVSQVKLAAARATERKLHGRFRIHRLLANGTFQFHEKIARLERFE
jgi:hypothetical protein